MVELGDHSVTCAIYAKENDLPDTDGWKQFKSIVKRQNNITRVFNQVKLRLYNTAPKC
jgi:hypothetical protein